MAQAVRLAETPYRSPTPEAYAAAVRALEKHREGEKVAHARSVQLAIQAEDMLRHLGGLAKTVDHGVNGEFWADRDETLLEFREQLAETLCIGGHAEGEPHVDFRPPYRPIPLVPSDIAECPEHAAGLTGVDWGKRTDGRPIIWTKVTYTCGCTRTPENR